MADIMLSPDDLVRLDESLAYLDPASHELVTPLREQLSPRDWEFVVSYIQQRLRSAMEIELMARAFASAAKARDLCDQRGADHFLRSKAWLHNFGIIQTSDEYFASLSATHDNRLTRALDALILIAQDLLFDKIEEDYRRLLNPR
ncbi:MAG: hypothetical protein ACLGHL_05415 [Actinomycetota bacterium]